ncbi:MAG: hypothetical protein D6820_03395 [Lentisphaerae bacterium]|nr:MAG: hypothetical protein D6820_03395 [Lentisphaerota bacterium]
MFRQTKMKHTTVLVDPPRQGLHRSLLHRLRQFQPAQILYISCGPDTLARDLANILPDSPYRLRDLFLIDMFPRTRHFETVAFLQKQ